MAMRTTSKKVAEAIRDDVNEWVRDYAELTDMPPGCEPTPWAVYQEIKHQMAYEFARFGQYEAMRSSLQALSFGDFMNAREHVQRWLGQTDAEADRYGEERAEELYCHLVDRELSKLVRQTMPKGLCTEVNPHLSQGKAVEAVTVYDRRERIANVPSLAAANARWLKSYLDRSISESGSLPDGVLLLAGLRCQNAPNPIEAALSQLSERVPKYANACKRLMDERRDGRIDDDQYYERMAGVDKAMRFDLDMSLIACEEVDLEADRYFTESGCRKAMSPEERAAGRNEQARATFATATARAEQRNTNLKTEVQNRQPVGQALTR